MSMVISSPEKKKSIMEISKAIHLPFTRFTYRMEQFPMRKYGRFWQSLDTILGRHRQLSRICDGKRRTSLRPFSVTSFKVSSHKHGKITINFTLDPG